MNMFRRWFLLALAASLPAAACEKCGADYSGSSDQAPTIILPGPGTPAAGAFSVALGFDYARFEGRSGREAHALHEQGRHSHARIDDRSATLAFSAGLGDAAALSLTVPYMRRSEYESDAHERIGARQHSAGLGDATIGIKFRFSDAGSGATAFFAGLTLPTGADDRLKPGGDPYEAELQPGAGATALRLGVTTRRVLDEHSALTFAGSATLRGGGARDYRFGNVLRLDAGWSRAAGGRAHLLIEGSALTSGRDREAGEPIEDSGTRFALFVAPGLHLRLGGAWSAWLSVPVAVIDRERGVHQESRYEVLTGIALRL